MMLSLSNVAAQRTAPAHFAEEMLSENNIRASSHAESIGDTFDLSEAAKPST